MSLSLSEGQTPSYGLACRMPFARSSGLACQNWTLNVTKGLFIGFTSAQNTCMDPRTAFSSTDSFQPMNKNLLLLALPLAIAGASWKQ